MTHLKWSYPGSAQCANALTFTFMIHYSFIDCVINVSLKIVKFGLSLDCVIFFLLNQKCAKVLKFQFHLLQLITYYYKRIDPDVFVAQLKNKIKNILFPNKIFNNITKFSQILNQLAIHTARTSFKIHPFLYYSTLKTNIFLSFSINLMSATYNLSLVYILYIYYLYYIILILICFKSILLTGFTYI